MPIQYNSKKIIPAPLVNISQEYVKSGDTLIGSIYKIVLSGTMCANKGSPDSTGTFWTVSGNPPDEALSHDEHLKSILVKQATIRELFSDEGKSLEIQPWDGSAPLKCNPRIVSVEVPEGQWFNTAPYSVTLEADVLYGAETTGGETSFTQFLSDAKEDWVIDTEKQIAIDGTYSYRLSHTVSATGRKHYDAAGTPNNPYDDAKSWVQARLGFNATIAASTGAINTGSSSGYNQLRSETTDILGGTYSVTETWVISNLPYIEDCTIETSTSVDDGITKISIQGTVEGLESRDSNNALTQQKYDAAAAAFATISGNLYTRAQTYSGVSGININPSTTSIGKNPITGIITYTYSYDNRPSNLIAGVLSEIISIEDNNPTDIFASLPVLGRVPGPVLQDMETVSQRERILTIEARLLPSNNLLTGQPDVSSIITTVEPTEGDVYRSTDKEVWNAKQGSYSRTVAWTWVRGT